MSIGLGSEAAAAAAKRGCMIGRSRIRGDALIALLYRILPAPGEIGAMRESGRQNWLGRRAPAAIMTLLAVVLVASVFAHGLNRGMHRLYSGPLDTRAQQVAAAISDVAYGLNLKYAFHQKIHDTLNKGGMSDVADNLKPLGLVYPAHFKNTSLWNELLERVSHLSGINADVKVDDRTLGFIHVEDLGLVDFYKLSFRLFGYNVQGFYYTYFLLLGISVLLVVAAFWRRPVILLWMNFLLFGLVLSIIRLDPDDSVANGRFLCSLAVVPAFHLAVLLWQPSRPDPWSVIAAVTQALFLVFVIFMRASAQWVVILLVLIIAGFMLVKLWHLFSACSLKALTRELATWPVVVIAVSLTAGTAYLKAGMHPAYSTLGELRPGHLFWASIAYGLSWVEDIDELVPGLNGARADALGTYLAFAHMKRTMGFTPTSQYLTSYHFPQHGQMNTYERVVREAYVDFVVRHPRLMLYQTFIKKPQMLLHEVRRLLGLSILGNPAFVFGLAAAFAAAVWSVAPLIWRRMDMSTGAWVVLAMALASTIPSIVAYPVYLADAFAVYAAVLAVPALLAGATWALRLRRVLPALARST